MSALLDDIINLAADGQHSLSDILRKCLILGHDLKNERLKAWAKQELSGYEDFDAVPDYRVLDAPAKGNFVGPLLAQYPRHLIPPIALGEHDRMWASKVRLCQAVKVLEEALAKSKTHLTFPWPGDLVAKYQTDLMEGGWVLHEAWQEVSIPMVSAIPESVRNKTLEIALGIKDELGTSYQNLSNVKAEAVEKIQQIIFQNTGGITNVALGQSSVDAHSQHQTHLGDRAELDDLLRKAGLDNSDLGTLTKAITDDGGKQPGPEVGGWIKQMASKIVVGGAKVGASIGQQILTAWLMQHYGLSR